jgi:hypothetical protein
MGEDFEVLSNILSKKNINSDGPEQKFRQKSKKKYQSSKLFRF